MGARLLLIQHQENSTHDVGAESSNAQHRGRQDLPSAVPVLAPRQCAAANCSLSVEPASAVVDASGLIAEVTWSK